MNERWETVKHMIRERKIRLSDPPVSISNDAPSDSEIACRWAVSSMQKPEKKFVLCLNYEHFERWRRENGLSQKECVYVVDGNRVRGCELKEDQVVILDGFWRRRDALELDRAVRERIRL